LDANTSIEQLLVTAVVQNRREGQRAVSSHKFDDLLRKNCSRRLKKGKITLFQYAKELERKESDSKKSTDYSNSEEIEQLRTENELYREFLEL
jgi:response regulator RpfG family c-di-GMP phosphodiesterase